MNDCFGGFFSFKLLISKGDKLTILFCKKKIFSLAMRGIYNYFVFFVPKPDKVLDST